MLRCGGCLEGVAYFDLLLLVQLHQLRDGVNVPPQNSFLNRPGVVPLTQFLSKNGVFPVGLRLCVWVEYPVNCVKKVPQHLLPLLRDSLDNGNKSTQVDVDLGCCGGFFLVCETPHWSSNCGSGVSVLFSALVATAASKGCTWGLLWRSIEAFSMPATVSEATQKYGAMSIYPIVRERCNPTSWAFPGFLFGISKGTDGVSSIRTHSRMCSLASYNLIM